MKWYEDPVYIKMCERNPYIQIPHWEKGWQEGDYLYDGKKVCLCGMDYLQVLNIFRDGRNRVRFAIREPMTAIVYEQPSPLSTVAMKTGDYEIFSLNNGTWLPRQDQLQEMVGEPLWQLNFRFIDWLRDKPYDGHINHSHLDFKSMEQLWLAFYMSEKHSRVWEDKWVKR